MPKWQWHIEQPCSENSVDGTSRVLKLLGAFHGQDIGKASSSHPSGCFCWLQRFTNQYTHHSTGTQAFHWYLMNLMPLAFWNAWKGSSTAKCHTLRILELLVHRFCGIQVASNQGSDVKNNTEMIKYENVIVFDDLGLFTA